MNESELFVVDEFPFLSFANSFDGESDLFFELVPWSVAEVRDPSVHSYDGLYGGEGVFSGAGGVVDEGFRNFDVFGENGVEIATRESQEKSGTLRSAAGAKEHAPSSVSTGILSALLSSTFVLLTLYVPPATCTQGSMERRYRGVMDIIRGAVFVVLARLRATEEVTLRCRRLRWFRWLLRWRLWV